MAIRLPPFPPNIDVTTYPFRTWLYQIWQYIKQLSGFRGTATLVGGSAVVATTAVTATSKIILTVQSLGTVAAPKAIAVTARTPGTSFTITSADNTDTSVVAWEFRDE